MTKERVYNAFKATRSLGLPDEEVKPVLKDLLRVYDKNWELIEAEDYRALIDAYFELKETKVNEGEKKSPVIDVLSERASKRLCFEVQEDEASSTFGGTSITGLQLGNRESSQLCSESRKERRTESTSLFPKRQSSQKRKDPIQSERPDRGTNSTSGMLSGHRNSGQPLVECGFSCLKRKNVPINCRGTSITGLQLGNRESSQLCSESRKETRTESTSLFPKRQSSQKRKDPIQSERPDRGTNSTSGMLSGHRNSGQPLVECGFSCLKRKNVPINCRRRDDIKIRTEHTMNDSADVAASASVIHPVLCLASPGTRATASTVNMQPQTISRDQKRSLLNINDISKGTETVKISLIDNTGNGDFPRFNYMRQNVIYQNAHMHISLARIADEDCCSSCSGDCLSSPIPCACASETGGVFAYTQQGLLKMEFLRDCVSMKLDPQNHHYVFCQDCPLERSKNEYMPEQCKGHLFRKFIKECWIKCGCDKSCGNRVVQRGITRSLQVFLTRESKGWGLRTLESLPKGAFVCEYVGEILTNMELYERNQNSGNKRHTYPVTLDADWGSERVLRDEEALCLDATSRGNVARFINHRCGDANLIDIPVQVETPDRHYYHLAFFTTREVSPLEELTWDYGIDFDDHDHPIKAFQCCCGSASCRDVNRKRRRSLNTRRRGDTEEKGIHR